MKEVYFELWPGRHRKLPRREQERWMGFQAKRNQGFRPKDLFPKSAAWELKENFPSTILQRGLLSCFAPLQPSSLLAIRYLCRGMNRDTLSPSQPLPHLCLERNGDENESPHGFRRSSTSLCGGARPCRKRHTQMSNTSSPPYCKTNRSWDLLKFWFFIVWDRTGFLWKETHTWYKMYASGKLMRGS